MPHSRPDRRASMADITSSGADTYHAEPRRSPGLHLTLLGTALLFTAIGYGLSALVSSHKDRLARKAHSQGQLEWRKRSRLHQQRARLTGRHG